jgi:hypothetical protein
MANSKSIGVAFEDQNISGSDYIYADGQIGYTANGQGSVTQSSSKTTPVTLNKSMGRITMNGASLAANTAVTFTLNNNLISAKDVIILNVSGGGTAGAYTTYVSSMTTGSAEVTLRNLTAGPLLEAVIVNFAIIHGQ